MLGDAPSCPATVSSHAVCLAGPPEGRPLPLGPRPRLLGSSAGTSMGTSTTERATPTRGEWSGMIPTS
jgi:hypothetical protein